MGDISKQELTFYLNHWCIKVTDEQLDNLYNKFDADGDGKINYEDFQKTAGKEIHPMEGLYFRQDVRVKATLVVCKNVKCT